MTSLTRWIPCRRFYGLVLLCVLLLIGVGLFVLGLRMAILLFRSYARHKETIPAMQARPAEAD